MATYYKLRRKAIARIKDTIRPHKMRDLNEIELIILSEFGLGRKFVMDSLKLFEKNGQIEIDHDRSLVINNEHGS